MWCELKRWSELDNGGGTKERCHRAENHFRGPFAMCSCVPFLSVFGLEARMLIHSGKKDGAKFIILSRGQAQYNYIVS